MKNTVVIALAVIALSLAASCKKKKEDEPTVSTDNVLLKIEHTWNGNSAFAMETDLVHPVTGDSLNFTTFRYYLSNIRLKKTDGSWWTQPDSYFLLDLSISGTAPTIALNNVPHGEYTDIEYVLGVDSTHNVSGAQSGDLSPALGMFWNWNTGYIMLKAEGISPDAADGSFAYHLGGFTGANSVVTKNTHTFTGNNLSVTGNGNCVIDLTAAPETLWSTIGSVSVLAGIHMPGADAKTLANDFYGSFAFDQIHE
jgi:hypothetical protein